MGNVYIKEKSALFQVKAKEDVKKLIEIFNGNIYLEKRKIQFEK
jgi:hypothetical protein